MIVGASDRMLTASDIEFEPEQTKIYDLSSHVVALAAGSSFVQSELSYRTAKELHILPRGLVQEVAEVYRAQFESYRLARAESTLLSPLGLSLEKFTKQQQGLSTSLVTRASSKN